MTSAGSAEAAMALTTAYRFWFTLILRCQRRHTCVGGLGHIGGASEWQERRA